MLPRKRKRFNNDDVIKTDKTIEHAGLLVMQLTFDFFVFVL